MRSYDSGWEIYSLAEPEGGKVKYIGVSRDSKERLWFHIRFADKRDTPVRQWVDDLLQQNKMPVMEVVQRGKGPSYYRKEKELIVKLRSEGVELLNILSGGTGRKASKPFTEEHKAKLVACSKGHKIPEALKQKMIAGRRRFLEQQRQAKTK